METVLLVPGFTEDKESRDYQLVLEAIEAKGYRVQFFQIEWSRESTVNDWVNQLCEALVDYDLTTTILAGFSVGAIIAFAAAIRMMPSQLWLFSTPAYFGEDLPNATVLSTFSEQQYQAFQQLPYEPRKIKCPVLLFVGTIESPETQRRARLLHHDIPHSKLMEVPGADHDVAQPAFIVSLKQHI